MRIRRLTPMRFLAGTSLAVFALSLSGHAGAATEPPLNPPYLPDLAAIPELAALPEVDGEDLTVPEELPGEIAVDVRDDLSDTEIAELGSAYGIALRPNSPFARDDGNLEIASVDPSAEPRLLERLANDPRVEHAEPITLMRALFVPNDPKYGEQWHLTRAGSEKAWEYACGAGVTVAVVDTGVACYNKSPFTKGSDLSGTRCVDGYNFVNDTPDAADDQGHGTHVAGTIAQTTNNGVGVAGLAFCARLMPVKVLSSRGFGTMADVAEGIRWAADHGAQVINLSLGSPSKSKIVEDAVTHAYKKGVVVVAAAGNSGRSVGYPAAYAGAIAVSATDRNDGIAWFSSRGPQIAIGAPGVAVTQQTICQNGRNKCELYGVFNGTSMASPHVAGAAAMIVGLGVTDPDAVRSALQSSAVPKGDKNLFGAGLLAAGAAAAHTHWMHVATRLGALLVLAFFVASRIKKNGGTVAKGIGKVLGALIGAVGLLPIAPLLAIPSHLGPTRWVGELLMRPLGEWDLILDAGLHRWLPLANALPALALTALFFGAKRLRPFIGGLALGSAAFLVVLAATAGVNFALGPFVLRIWTIANALVCFWLARVSLDAKRS